MKKADSCLTVRLRRASTAAPFHQDLLGARHAGRILDVQKSSLNVGSVRLQLLTRFAVVPKLASIVGALASDHRGHADVVGLARLATPQELSDEGAAQEVP
jgi:hypothetical protein